MCKLYWGKTYVYIVFVHIYTYIHTYIYIHIYIYYLRETQPGAHSASIKDMETTVENAQKSAYF